MNKQIVYKKIDQIKPYEKNPRKNDEAVEYVANSIKEFGFKDNICVIENKYIITDKGKVYTIYYDKRGIKEQKPRKHTNGYLKVTIFGKDQYIHRLVGYCFLDNPNNYKEISHEDNDKTNNDVNNLKWCTRSYNNKKVFIDGIRTSKEMKKIAKKPKLGLRKLENEIVKEIKKSKLSDSQLSKIYNITRGTAYQIRHDKTYREVI